ncbi:hypothetical protein CFP56_038947 [Quercus suber]|uniref:Uncharacterized protein n=1 Tax=Quercus suber TaxID=58331 RepID=A0AAW0J106_QUESU
MVAHLRQVSAHPQLICLHVDHHLPSLGPRTSMILMKSGRRMKENNVRCMVLALSF